MTLCANPISRRIIMGISTTNLIRFIIGAQLGLLTFLSYPAFSSNSQGITIQEFRVMRKLAERANVRIEGNLICQMGTENNGQNCDLKIQEANTGKIYRVAGNATDSTMRLFHSGTRQVALEGTLAENNTTIIANRSEAK